MKQNPNVPIRLIQVGLVLVFAAPFGATQAAGSLAGAQAQTPATEGGGALAKERVRLLHRRGGSVVRARSRWTGDRWEVLDGTTWRGLGPDDVLRHADEKELLSEARKRMSRAESRAERAAVARWMRGEGLLREWLETLDGILADDPDQADALAELRDTPPNLALPDPNEVREDYLRVAAGLPPAAREVAVRGLLRAADPLLLRADLERELETTWPKRRAFAALALRRLFPGQALEPLLARSVLDTSASVRSEAARALRDSGDTELTGALLRAMTSRHAGVRTHAAETLGALGDRNAVPHLIEHLGALSTVSTSSAASGEWRAPASHLFVGRQRAYVQDFDAEVAQGQSIADPVINTLVEGSVLDVRAVATTTVSVAAERAAVRRSLEALTGISPGHTSRAWRTWWESEGRSAFGVSRPETPER